MSNSSLSLLWGIDDQDRHLVRPVRHVVATPDSFLLGRAASLALDETIH